MQKYLSENLVDIFFLLGISSVVILVISALSIGYFIKKIPHDYFLDDKRGISEYKNKNCLLYTSPSPRDRQKSRMPSSA